MLELKNVIAKILETVRRAWDTYITYVKIDPDELEPFQVGYVLWGSLILVVLSFVFISFMLTLIKFSGYIVGACLFLVSGLGIWYIVKNLLERG